MFDRSRLSAQAGRMTPKEKARLLEVFSKSVQKALATKSSFELAGTFEVAPVTIRRWAEGSQAPHPYVQQYIIRSLRKKKTK